MKRLLKKNLEELLEMQIKIEKAIEIKMSMTEESEELSWQNESYGLESYVVYQ